MAFFPSIGNVLSAGPRNGSYSQILVDDLRRLYLYLRSVIQLLSLPQSRLTVIFVRDPEYSQAIHGERTIRHHGYFCVRTTDLRRDHDNKR